MTTTTTAATRRGRRCRRVDAGSESRHRLAEALEVHKNGNGWLAYTRALHLLRESGTLVGLLDLLDEVGWWMTRV